MQNLAQLERNLRDKDLSVFKVEPKKLLAKQIVQYQNFNYNSAKAKINRMNYSENTLKNYFFAGKEYIKQKKRKKGIPVNLYNQIDYWLNQKLQPLTPSESEKAIIRNAKTEINKDIAEKLEMEFKEDNGNKTTTTNETLINTYKKIIELQQKEIKLKDEYIELYKNLSEVEIEKI